MKILAHVDVEICESVEVNISADQIVDALNEMDAPEGMAQANRLISTCYSLIKSMDVTLFTEDGRKLIASKLREQAERYEVTP